MNKVMIIFGAGASSFSGPCVPNNPPLGNDLFAALAKTGNIPEKIVKTYGPIFQTEGFEAGMSKAFAELGSDAVIPIQRETAFLLSSFSGVPGNYYFELLRRLGTRALGNIGLATLNYDLLLEQALAGLGFQVVYQGDSVDPYKKASVLKLHGSSNFLPYFVGDSYIGGNVFMDCHTYVEGLPMKIATSHREIMAWAKEEKHDSLTPVISVYGPRKASAYNQSFIETTQATWRERVQQAKLIVVVGINYVPHDVHFWEPLTAAPGVVAIVNPDLTAYAEWMRDIRRGTTFQLAKTFADYETIAAAIRTQL